MACPEGARPPAPARSIARAWALNSATPAIASPWQALHGLQTPAEDQPVDAGQRLWLLPQELVYLPIKFQAWQHGQVTVDTTEQSPPSAGAGGQTGRELPSSPIAQRTVVLRVLNVQHEAVASLELRIRPQPYAIDRTFRFQQPEARICQPPSLRARVPPSKSERPRFAA